MSYKASKVFVFPNLTNESLVSIGQLYDDRCIIFFTKHNTFITKNGELITTGWRNNFDALWDVTLHVETTQQPTNIKQNSIN